MTYLRRFHECDVPRFQGTDGDKWRCDACGRTWILHGRTWHLTLRAMFRRRLKVEP